MLCYVSHVLLCMLCDVIELNSSRRDEAVQRPLAELAVWSWRGRAGLRASRPALICTGVSRETETRVDVRVDCSVATSNHGFTDGASNLLRICAVNTAESSQAFAGDRDGRGDEGGRCGGRRGGGRRGD